LTIRRVARHNIGENVMSLGKGFAAAAKACARGAGHPAVFGIAVLAILLWAVSGPLFGFSDTWQLVVNTSTTIVTFLMVFLIQNTQNRDSVAVQLKLDEIIRALDNAHNAVIDLEALTDRELDHIHARYRELAEEAREAVRQGRSDKELQEVDQAGLFEGFERKPRRA
jgi:low affinity Fe/Cu permease